MLCLVYGQNLWCLFFKVSSRQLTLNDLSGEAKAFAYFFCRQEFSVVRKSCFERYTANCTSSLEKDQAKIELYAGIRCLFSASLSEHLWTRVAASRGLLPAGLEHLLIFDKDAQYDLISSQTERFEFLQSCVIGGAFSLHNYQDCTNIVGVGVFWCTLLL